MQNQNTTFIFFFYDYFISLGLKPNNWSCVLIGVWSWFSSENYSILEICIFTVGNLFLFNTGGIKWNPVNIPGQQSLMFCTQQCENCFYKKKIPRHFLIMAISFSE